MSYLDFNWNLNINMLQSMPHEQNEKCPLTMKSVYELSEPVADKQGIIYERSAIIDFIRSKTRGGQVAKCPVAGQWILAQINVQKAFHASFN